MAFEKGRARHPASGRAKGTPNKTTRLLRECILEACTLLGRDGKGKDGLIGYLMKIGAKHPDLMVSLLCRVLPMQLVGAEPTTPGTTMTREQLEAKMRERGLPLAFDPPLKIPPPQPAPQGTRLN